MISEADAKEAREVGECIKICERERDMRQQVFRTTPERQMKKMEEMNRVIQALKRYGKRLLRGDE